VSEKIRVLYIAAKGRSGTTVMGNILNEFEGCFHTGEVIRIWEAIADGTMTGSGKPIRESDIWRPVIEQAFGNIDVLDVESRIQRLATVRTRRQPLLWFKPTHRYLLNAQTTQFMQDLEKLYTSIRDVTGAKIIVDSSKNPIYAYLLSRIPSIDLRVIHVVRDPRGAAYSALRAKPRKDNSSMDHLPKYSSTHSALVWMVWNFTVQTALKENAGAYKLLHYEDFAESPKSAVKDMLDFAEVGADKLDDIFVSDDELQLSPNHTVTGNPNRFNSGIVKIKVDQRWKTEMSSLQKFWTTLLTLPLLMRMNYSISE